MTTFAAAARTIALVASLIMIGGVVYLGTLSLNAKLGPFGPGCAAEFSC